MKKLLWIMVGLGVSGFALADNSYRCGNGIVRLEMSFEQVTKACGNLKPIEVRTGSVDKGLSGYRYSDGTMPIVTDQLEDWYFAPYGKFVTVVRFTNGYVRDIARSSERAGK